MMTLKRPSRRQVLIAGGLGSGLLISGAWKRAHPSGMQTGHRAGIAFGTTVTLKAMHHDAVQLEVALDAAWNEIVEVEKAASLFSPGSALSRLNRDGLITNAPAALIDMLTSARDISELTDGAFDITVQPLWALYDAAFKAGRLPVQADLEPVRDLIGFQKVLIDGADVRLTRPGMALTLNGIAQGYATENCLRVLATHGVTNAFLNTGEIGAAGKRDGLEPWTAGIADPRRNGEFAALARPLQGVLATSGDYGTTFSGDFTSHHIFDPKTLRSPVQMASVSVLAQSGAYADALATAMMVMAPEECIRVAEMLEGIEALLIDKQGKITRTSGFPVA